MSFKPGLIGGVRYAVFNCILGWQEAAFSRVAGKPVTAEIEETVLRGGSRCSFRITIQG